MSSFLAVPLKKTYKVDLVTPLKNFIRSTYTHADPDVYTQALPEFDNLRNSVISKFQDKHESALEVLYRYYDQLVAVENKLPITENQNRVQFKWKCAFEESGFLASGKNLAISSAAYEKACLLFNIAALQSQVAAVQNHDNNDGLKLAVKLFQQAGGIFEHLIGSVMSSVQQEPTFDLHQDPLFALRNLMLAQAQEAIYKKATQDKMKDTMVARVCLHVSKLYAETIKFVQSLGNRGMCPKDWIGTVLMKQASFHALSEYYQSRQAAQDRCYGEEICRLKKALELFGTAQSRGGQTFCFQRELAIAKKALDAAVKDNDFIYHDKIPNYADVKPITDAAVAKCLALASPMSSNFTDLFVKLVPLPVQEAMTSFDSRKSQALNMEVGRLREATQLINSVLASLNLPAAIEDLSGEGVPQSLLEKAQQIQDLGGLAKIKQLMNDLPELLNRNREILNESLKCLDDEENSDKQLKEQFKERWTRTPSGTLTRPMRDEATKYKTILDTAIQADQIVKEKYNTHEKAIALLSKPKGELEASLPSANAAASLQNSGVVSNLKELIEQVNTIKAERDVIESELKDAKFDMREKFIEALTADGAVDEERLSGTELERIYSPLREQISDSIMRQEKVLASIQTANTEFCNAKSSNQTAAQRETLLKDLAAGFDSYMELKGNLEEGTKFWARNPEAYPTKSLQINIEAVASVFYNDLTPLLVKLQTKINDFCFARKTEKDELMADLQKAIANSPSGAPPAQPAYQGGPGQQPTTQEQPTTGATSPAGGPTPKPRAAPPARPPPPTVPPATAAAASATDTAAPSIPPRTYAASAPSGPSAPLPYSPNPADAAQAQRPAYGQPQMPYGQGQPGYGGASWQAPYPSYPGASYPMPQMPTGYNPYNPYMGYPQQPPQGYPGMQPPPQQPYPGQQQFPGQQQQAHPQAGYPGYPYPSYAPQGGMRYPSQQQ